MQKKTIVEKIPGLRQLSVADKLSLVAEVWEELEGMGESLPVTEEQKRILDARFARHGENPEPGRPWPEVKDRLLARIAR